MADALGFWECSYARAEEVLAVSEATTVLDCVAGTITTDATFVVDNGDGLDAIEFSFCGASAVGRTSWGVAGSGTGDSGQTEIPVTVACP